MMSVLDVHLGKFTEASKHCYGKLCPEMGTHYPQSMTSYA
jgi:hypothetical protein